MSEIKNTLNGIKGRLDITLKSLIDLKTAIETLQNNPFQDLLHSCQKKVLLALSKLNSSHSKRRVKWTEIMHRHKRSVFWSLELTNGQLSPYTISDKSIISQSQESCFLECQLWIIISIMLLNILTFPLGSIHYPNKSLCNLTVLVNNQQIGKFCLFCLPTQVFMSSDAMNPS